MLLGRMTRGIAICLLLALLVRPELAQRRYIGETTHSGFQVNRPRLLGVSESAAQGGYPSSRTFEEVSYVYYDDRANHVGPSVTADGSYKAFIPGSDTFQPYEENHSPFKAPRKPHSYDASLEQPYKPRQSSRQEETAVSAQGVCHFHGQYVAHPEQPCQYLLCTAYKASWRTQTMPCPPGMAARTDRHNFGYPCKLDLQTCPPPLEDATVNEVLQPYANQPGRLDGELRANPFVEQDYSATIRTRDWGLGWYKSAYCSKDTGLTRDMPFGAAIEDQRPTRVREFIHGLQDDPEHMYSHKDMEIPTSYTRHLQVPPAGMRDAILEKGLRQKDFMMDDPSLESPRKEPVRVRHPGQDRKPTQKRHKLLVVEEPGLSMAVEETSEMQLQRHPGYRRREQTSRRSNTTHTTGINGPGDTTINESHEEMRVTSSQDTRESNSYPAGRMGMQSRMGSRGVDGELMSLPPHSLQLVAPRDAVVKRSFVHMPRIPQHLLHMFRDMYNEFDH